MPTGPYSWSAATVEGVVVIGLARFGCPKTPLGEGEVVTKRSATQHVGSDRKFPICNDPKFLTFDLSLKAYRPRSVGFANRAGSVRRCTDGRPGCC